MTDTLDMAVPGGVNALRALDRLNPGDPEFMPAILKILADVTDCRLTGIGLRVEDTDRIEVREIYDRQGAIVPFSYSFASGPCEIVYSTSPKDPFRAFPAEVSTRFHAPDFMTSLGVQGYLAEAIYDPEGQVFAHVFAIDTDPIALGPGTEITFRLLAQRIGATLIEQRAQDALRHSQMRYRTVIDEIADAIFIHDLDGHFLDVNEQACAALGYSRDELLQMSVGDVEVAIPCELVMENWRKARLGKLVVQEGVHVRKDGTRFPTEIRGRLIQLEGEPVVIVSARDVSDLKVTEISLLEARRDAEAASRAKSQFVANMSHELRTPLNAIIGFSDILKEQHLGPIGHDRYAEYADDIHRSGQHLLRLVSDILDLSKIEAGQETLRETVFMPDTVVADSLAILSDRARRKSIKFQTESGTGDVWLRADEVKLEQILINLLANAVKFSFIGGRILITSRLMDDGGFEIVVGDSGPGIEPDRLEQAFESFQRLDSAQQMAVEGTGLGLPIARKLCELHGGSVHLESEPGKGTNAIVRMPRHRVVPPAAITQLH